MVHHGKAKITDFGNSKSMNTATNIHDGLFGNIPYVAPEVLNASKTKQDPYTIYSDIYSLGVLLWEISSGQSPFKDESNYAIITATLSGDREKRVPDTPDKYYTLYNQCWHDNPEERHSVEYVYNVLEKLLKNESKIMNNNEGCEPEKEIDEGK